MTTITAKDFKTATAILHSGKFPTVKIRESSKALIFTAEKDNSYVDLYCPTIASDIHYLGVVTVFAEDLVDIARKLPNSQPDAPIKIVLADSIVTVEHLQGTKNLMTTKHTTIENKLAEYLHISQPEITLEVCGNKLCHTLEDLHGDITIYLSGNRIVFASSNATSQIAGAPIILDEPPLEYCSFNLNSTELNTIKEATSYCADEVLISVNDNWFYLSYPSCALVVYR